VIYGLNFVFYDVIYDLFLLVYDVIYDLFFLFYDVIYDVLFLFYDVMFLLVYDVIYDLFFLFYDVIYDLFFLFYDVIYDVFFLFYDVIYDVLFMFLLSVLHTRRQFNLEFQFKWITITNQFDNQLIVIRMIGEFDICFEMSLVSNFKVDSVLQLELQNCEPPILIFICDSIDIQFQTCITLANYIYTYM